VTGDMAHQPHYEDDKIQPIEIMRANFSKEELVGFYKGNVIKYVSRAQRKNGVEDLEKAAVYLGWWIELEKGSCQHDRLIDVTSHEGSERELLCASCGAVLRKTLNGVIE